MADISLDRRKFTGKIELDTPCCVISDIANSMGISADINLLNSVEYRARVISTINKVKIVSVKEPYTEYDLHEIARYVNPDTNVIWRGDQLLRSFNLIENNHPDMSQYGIGNPTPGGSNVLPISIHYRYFLMYKGMARHDLTPHDLILYCQLSGYERESLIMLLTNEGALCDHVILRNLMLNILSVHRRGRACEDKINQISHLFKNGYKLPGGRSPRTPEEAVLITALTFSIDISSSDEPLQDYHNVLVNKPFINENMRIISSINPRAYRLTHIFNPLFPIHMYNNQTLAAMCKGENINLNNLDNQGMYYELSINYLTDTFHYSLLDGVQNFITDLTLVDIVKDRDIPVVSYGSRDSGMYVITVEELIDIFKNDECFTSPRGGIYSQEAINKLYSIAVTENERKLRRPGNRNRVWGDLINVINLVNSYRNNLTKISEKFNRYRGNKEIIYTLTMLKELALYMRGWDGKSNYPMRDYPVYNQCNVDVNVTQAMARYRTSTGKDIINQLQLLDYRYGAYNIVSDKRQGLTVGERIDIVVSNTSTDVSPCIRLSSNLLLASSHFYLISMGEKDSKLDITQMAHIS